MKKSIHIAVGNMNRQTLAEINQVEEETTTYRDIDEHLLGELTSYWASLSFVLWWVVCATSSRNT